MKIFFVFLFFIAIFLAQGQVSRNPDVQLSLATTAMIEAFKTISNLDTKEYKNVKYAIELLTNLTTKLANSTNKTCQEYFII